MQGHRGSRHCARRATTVSSWGLREHSDCPDGPTTACPILTSPPTRPLRDGWRDGRISFYCAHRPSTFRSCAVCEQGSWPPVSRTCVTRKSSFQFLPLSPLRLAVRRGPLLRASNEGLLRPRVPRAKRALLIASPSPHTPSLADIDSRNSNRPDSVGRGRRRYKIGP
jgi:hypothetical protein